MAADLRQSDLTHKQEIRLQRFGRAFSLRNIRLALHPFSRCLHSSVRYWGDNYAHGVRCLQCGEELSQSHENALQVLESSDELGLLVYQHRIDESAPDQHVAPLLQAERLRVEKEDRLLQLSSTRRLPAVTAHTSLSWQQPCRFRHNLRRDSWVKDLEFLARVAHFETRVGLLRRQHERHVLARRSIINHLASLHEEGRQVSKLLRGVEDEHLQSEELLKSRADARQHVQNLREQLRVRLIARAEAETTRCGKEEKAQEAELELEAGSHDLEEAMIAQKQLRERVQTMKDETSDAEAELAAASKKLSDAGFVLRKLAFSEVGATCNVPRWGRGKVVRFRVGSEKDEREDMVTVKVRWGLCMSAMVSVRASIVAEADACREKEELKLLAVEDELQRRCAAIDRSVASRERLSMAAEEALYHEAMRLERKEAMRKREMTVATESARWVSMAYFF